MADPHETVCVMAAQACPRCGKKKAKRIAPGYYECTAKYDDETCGQRFQTGPEAGGLVAYCKCGTIALGRCNECHRYVCGDHSSAGAVRTCDSCLEDRIQRGEEQDAAEKQQRVQALRTEINDFLHAMAEAGNPGTRRLKSWGPKGWVLGEIDTHHSVPAHKGGYKAGKPYTQLLALSVEGELRETGAEPGRPCPSTRWLTGTGAGSSPMWWGRT